MSFKATYSRWLNTHGRSHKQYYRRKHYPWGILSRIDFTPEKFNQQQTIPVGTREMVVEILHFEYNQATKRYNYEFIFHQGNEINKFKAVFSYDGILITIYCLDDPFEKIYKSLWSNNCTYNTMMNLKSGESMLRQLIIEKVKLGKQWEITAAYEPQKIDEQVLQEIIIHKAKKLKKKQIVIPFSKNRDVWINIYLTKERAIKYGLSEATQCAQFFALYLIDDYSAIPSPSKINIEWLDVKNFFHRELSMKDLQALRNLANIKFI